MPLEDDPLEPAQMARVNGNTVVVARSTLSDECPVSILLLQVESGRVGDESQSDKGANEAEPADDPESCSATVVIEHDGGDEGTEFTGCGGETVGGSSD